MMKRIILLITEKLNNKSMKNLFYLLMLLVITGILSSCATIIGGSKYYAKVQVPDYPDARIEYKGYYQGNGEASFKAQRKEANNFSVTIKKEGCETQTTNFTQRSFRGLAFAGTVVGFTGFVPGTFIPLPWGVLVDGVTGALWQPDINEKGVTKQDLNHYIYRIDYTGCDDQDYFFHEEKSTSNSKANRLRELKQLVDENILTQEEYEKEKTKILDEK